MLEQFWTRRLNGDDKGARAIYEARGLPNVSQHTHQDSTIDYAFMYLPSEAIYYELTLGSESPDEPDILAYFADRHVIPASPNTLLAYLQVVALGIRGLAMQERTLDVCKDRREEIPGVVHVDGSGRLQTVAREDQPLYYRLISKFHEITGVPVVLNTSFNLAGEPIVCSPYDAIRTFYTSGMDALDIGKFVLRKS